MTQLRRKQRNESCCNQVSTYVLLVALLLMVLAAILYDGKKVATGLYFIPGVLLLFIGLAIRAQEMDLYKKCNPIRWIQKCCRKCRTNSNGAITQECDLGSTTENQKQTHDKRLPVVNDADVLAIV
mmetsp:Transcript_6006/g.9370  ORF Transcript_6006/g.9370 Transcript_6006/m.9370 type:complete len:126 (-) Transcript_6006:35-412(-)|eukprot:CAMPEP_0203757708 /NCGR_PEP_ID=MMETSP0098-20131031/10643_1 /ASSEMBLY_ACC=CAM_ASM_000208 /TAXON_ID=96639 /ORGANISM=" , Strain NY0313808BC1" /LENGTH=125 /DNA_ID=CAMNT_0050649937 /DNA_START=359 /DNA_END=736 /DNA_ORIENTATION=-